MCVITEPRKEALEAARGWFNTLLKGQEGAPDTTTTARVRIALPRPGILVSGSKLKKAMLGLAVIAGIFATADYGHYYWAVGPFLVTTDDAYIDAHSTLMSPKVSGYISDVSVNDNEAVKTGQVIARIDPRDYQTALDQARAGVEAARAKIDTLTAQIAQQHLSIEQARQSVCVGSRGADLRAAECPSLQ